MAVVLVVDDEEDIRALLRVNLSFHEVHEASDGEEGLEKMIALKPDVAIVDVMMPGRDGHAMLTEVRARNAAPATRVIMLSARTSERDLMLGWKLGIAAYVTKPFEPDYLLRVVRETLDLSLQQIAERRRHELERANLFSQLESVFGDGNVE